MKLGFVFAGQGSQSIGMGKDLYEEYPIFQKTMDEAAESVKTESDFDLKKTCFEGPADMLNSTRFTQPCMVAFAVGITKMFLQEKIEPSMTLGLSLGEYSALYASGILDEKTVIPLVAYRGKVMEEAVTGRKVKMSAVLKAEGEIIREACLEAEKRLQKDPSTQDKIVEVANYNCPGQIVISGDAEAVDLAGEILKEKGIKRIIPLAVSGPFHTSLMKPAGDRLRERFETITFHPANSVVIHNLTAHPLMHGQTYEELLERQVQSSVLLEDSIRYMVSQKMDAIVEIGPGNTISKFIQKIAPETTVYQVDSVESFRQTISALNSI